MKKTKTAKQSWFGKLKDNPKTVVEVLGAVALLPVSVVTGPVVTCISSFCYATSSFRGLKMSSRSQALSSGEKKLRTALTIYGCAGLLVSGFAMCNKSITKNRFVQQNNRAIFNGTVRCLENIERKPCNAVTEANIYCPVGDVWSWKVKAVPGTADFKVILSPLVFVPKKDFKIADYGHKGTKYRAVIGPDGKLAGIGLPNKDKSCTHMHVLYYIVQPTSEVEKAGKKTKRPSFSPNKVNGPIFDA